MPEHFQVLIWPSERADPSRIVPSLKERAAKFILKNLQASREVPWCGRMLAALTLPPTVHLHGPYRVGQRRFDDMNVGSEKKRLEKLNDMHGNPVQRGIVTLHDQWPWPSFRFYFLKDDSVLPMDRRNHTHRQERDVCATRGSITMWAERSPHRMDPCLRGGDDEKGCPVPPLPSFPRQRESTWVARIGAGWCRETADRFSLEIQAFLRSLGSSCASRICCGSRHGATRGLAMTFGPVVNLAVFEHAAPRILASDCY